MIIFIVLQKEVNAVFKVGNVLAVKFISEQLLVMIISNCLQLSKGWLDFPHSDSPPRSSKPT